MRASIRVRIASFNAFPNPAPAAPSTNMVTPAPGQSVNQTPNPPTTLKQQVESLQAQMTTLLNSIQKS